MKDIDKMNLAECISVVRRLTPDELEYDVQWRVGARIEKLTRWIPVSERMPTEADFGIDKRFRVWLGGIDSTATFTEGKTLLVWDDEAFNSGWTEYDPNNCRVAFTHWQRITPPEDKV